MHFRCPESDAWSTVSANIARCISRIRPEYCLCNYFYGQLAARADGCFACTRQDMAPGGAPPRRTASSTQGRGGNAPCRGAAQGGPIPCAGQAAGSARAALATIVLVLLTMRRKICAASSTLSGAACYYSAAGLRPPRAHLKNSAPG